MRICKKGDRVQAGNKWGTVTNVASKGLFPYTIQWDDGRSEQYSAENFDKFGYQIFAAAPVSDDLEEIAQLDLDFSKKQEPAIDGSWQLQPLQTLEPAISRSEDCLKQLSLFGEDGSLSVERNLSSLRRNTDLPDSGDRYHTSIFSTNSAESDLLEGCDP